MTKQNMFGVVLWSDTDAQKAVIWCEDQGELAFYTPGDTSIHDAPALDAGDLIRFDLSVQENMRKASNPQLLMQSHSPNLPETLRNPPKPQRATNPAREAISRKVIELAHYFEPKRGPMAVTG
ncbi:hypothetical protein [Marivita sp. GX14005]|uniref:hypothetical protein n=1 Tax=Marivita sp. GX14005 TaxID=2942276 RepID=UPI0020196E35|nr:hypothetical protein [Marivita sp. GX14005]MCL3883602.1 hypothetical protein [Marivita sp. GX14005]